MLSQSIFQQLSAGTLVLPEDPRPATVTEGDTTMDVDNCTAQNQSDDDGITPAKHVPFASIPNPSIILSPRPPNTPLSHSTITPEHHTLRFRCSPVSSPVIIRLRRVGNRAKRYLGRHWRSACHSNEASHGNCTAHLPPRICIKSRS